MEYAILAGGPPHLLPDLQDPLFASAQWVGVDRGTYRLLKRGIRPVKAFGDFDSVDDEERNFLVNQDLDIHTYPAEKDQTDLEIAIDWVLTQDPERCWIVGATGGRLDHTLMNVQLLVKGQAHEIAMVDKQNIVTLLQPGTYTVARRSQYPYLSLIAYTETVLGIELEGFKYPLKGAELSWGSSLCISNELVCEQGKISISEGMAVFVRSRDADGTLESE